MNNNNNNNKETASKHSPIVASMTSKGGQKFLSAIVILSVLCFFALLAIKPTISTIFKLQKEAEEKQDILNQLDTKIENLSKLKMEYVKIQNDLPIIMNAIPAQPDADFLLGQIQTIARDSEVSVTELENSEVDILKGKNSKQDENNNSFSFEVAGTGSSENIAEFIKKLTNMQRVINIDTILTNKSQKLGEEIREYSIQGSAFFKDEL